MTFLFSITRLKWNCRRPAMDHSAITVSTVKKHVYILYLQKALNARWWLYLATWTHARCFRKCQCFSASFTYKSNPIQFNRMYLHTNVVYWIYYLEFFLYGLFCDVFGLCSFSLAPLLMCWCYSLLLFIFQMEHTHILYKQTFWGRHSLSTLSKTSCLI